MDIREVKKLVNIEPLDIKSVEITAKKWQEIRPIIIELGVWFDISECYNKLLLRCEVNDYTQSFIESLL